MVVWDFLFIPKHPPQEPPAAKKEQAKDDTQTAQKVQVNEQSPALQPFLPKKADGKQTGSDEADLADENQIVVDTPLYIVSFAETSGVVKSFQLKKYQETNDADSPKKELITDKHGSIFLSLAQNSLPAFATARFTPSATGKLTISDKPQSLSFSWASPRGF